MSSTAKRLAALEVAAERARAARIAENERLVELALRAISPADVGTLGEMLRAAPEQVAAAWEAVRAREGDWLPGGEEVQAWAAILEGAADDAVWPAPPAGTVAYFEAEAARCDEARTQVEEPSPAFITGARWCAAQWRYWAAQARVIGEQA